MAASDYEIVDPRFGTLIISHAQVQRLWTGGRWLEGPVYWPDAAMLVFSDIPHNRMMRWVDGPAPSTQTGITVTGLTNGKSHEFWVRAVNAVGNGMLSPKAVATPSPG